MRAFFTIGCAVALAMLSAATPLTALSEIGFEGMDYTDGGGSVPASPVMAVGPGHVVTAVNSAVQIFDLEGNSLFGPAPAGSLFGALPECSTGLFTPRVVYDEEHRRFILTFARGARSQNGGICLAVSASADPTEGWGNFHFYDLNDETGWLDRPQLGVADRYLVFGGNVFTYSGKFLEGRAWALDKVALYGANSAPLSTVSLANYDSPQPLHLQGFDDGTWPDHGEDVYLLANPYDGRFLRVFRWEVGQGTLSVIGDADLGSSALPINAPQSGGGLIGGGDWRPQGFAYRNGYGWTATGISCNPGSGTVNCARWAQIDIRTAGLGPAGVGIIASDNVHRYYPTVIANRCDDAFIAYTGSSTSIFPTAIAAARASTAPPGQITVERPLRVGEINYSAFDGSPYRWGDHSASAMAPDGSGFWTMAAYSKDTGTKNGRWGTYLFNFSNPNCPLSDRVFIDGFEN